MIPTPDETAASLASALVRAGRAGGGQRIALSNGTASASVIPLMNRRAFMGTLAGGLVIEDPTLMIVNLERITYFAGQRRLPTITGSNAYAKPGILMVYGPSFHEMYRRTAFYVDRILKGSGPRRPPGRAADEVRACD
jgi:hypothetical protein